MSCSHSSALSHAAQLIIGTLVAAIMLFFQVQAAPYNDISDDHLAAASSFSLLVYFLCSICFKYAAAFELPDIQERMSKEQELTYFVDTGLLALIVIVSFLSTLVTAFALFVAQLAAEGKRLRREALARMAALRLPTCEWQLAEGQSYVCFLSHYKVEAGADARYLKDTLDKMLGCPAYLDSSTLAECAAAAPRCHRPAPAMSHHQKSAAFSCSAGRPLVSLAACARSSPSV